MIPNLFRRIARPFASLSVALYAASGHAATVVVSTTLDEVDGNTSSIANLIASPGGTGISLREAIIAANNTPGADIITVPAGTYTLTRAGNDSTCLNGDLDINGSVTINGAGPATTIIQGASDANFTGSIGDKVIGINQDGTFTNLTVSISGVTIRYGRNTIAYNDPSFAYTGAGVDVFLTGTGNNITFSNCVIANNEHVNAYGGGVNVDSGTSGLPGDPAVNTVNRGTVTFISCVVTNNRTLSSVNVASGGGINLFADIHNVVLTNCVIANNWAATNAGATTGPGGGLYVRHTYGGTVTVNNCIITNNTAGAGGGGVVSAIKQTLNITGGIISGNSARSGGGGFFCATDVGPTTLSSVTISGNHANTSTGGGIIDTATASLTLNNCTITNNSAVTGGGIHVSGGSLVANYCRVVNNTATTGSAVAQSGGTASVANNWWGTSAPAALMSGTVGFTPWLQLTHTANPNQIFIPNSTTLTASFLTNSAGTFIPVGNLGTLIGLPILFNNPVRGTLSGAQAAIQSSGTATATYTAVTAGAGSANAIVDNQTTTASITIPTGVSSINRVQTTPTNLANVQWTVTFTNAVTNVTAANFSLVNGGLGGSPAIISVTPISGPLTTQWTVTASTGNGTGTLGLSMVNSTGVSALIVNLPFTGQVYTIDLVPPDTSITAQPPAITNSTSANFSFSGSDLGVGVSVFQCQLDGAAYTNCTSPVNFTGLAEASHTFNVRAFDGAGNTDASPATVTWVVDTTPPTIAIGAPSTTLTSTGAVSYVVTYADAHFNSSILSPANVTLNKTGTANGTVLVSAGSGTSRTVTITNTTGDGTLGISIAAGTASDTAGNTAPAAGPSATFTVDNTPPSITCPTNVTVSTDPGTCNATNIALGSPVVTDANGIANLVSNAPPSYSVGTNTVTWIVRDNVGLTNTCNQLVIVQDTEPPTINCSSNIIVNATGNCPVIVTFNVGATDNCSLTNLIVTPGTGSAFPVGTNLVNALAQDAAGNTNTCSFTVTVLAGPPPELSVTGDGTNIVVWWPDAFPCYALQQAANLVSPPAPITWVPFPGPFTTNNGFIYITNNIGPSNLFLRLAY